MEFETEDKKGVILGWNFPRHGLWFQATGNERGTLHATSSLDIEVEVRCTFQFSGQGATGESLGSMGYLHAERRIRFRADAELAFSGLATSNPALDTVEFEPIVEHVDFGNVEPPLKGDGSMCRGSADHDDSSAQANSRSQQAGLVPASLRLTGSLPLRENSLAYRHAQNACPYKAPPKVLPR